MGFQDNAGGIVLDAVLTDIGRKRMAQGSFEVDKFALGDDEIDYSLYTPPTGSDSRDFSKLAGAPVMEAFGSQNSNINHGLQNFIREDILYIPSLKVNTKSGDDAVKVHSNGFYHLAANAETTRKIALKLSGRQYVLENNKIERTKLVL